MAITVPSFSIEIKGLMTSFGWNSFQYGGALYEIETIGHLTAEDAEERAQKALRENEKK